MVMDQGNSHLVDNDLKFTINWKLAHFPKSTLPHLKPFVDFFRSRGFFICTNPESWQNFGSYDILHVHVALI